LKRGGVIEAERYAAGVLHYCFSGGTNTPEYVLSINHLVEEIILGRDGCDFPDYLIIVSHGFALRVIVQYLLKITEEEFRRLRNPPNGYHLELQYFPSSGMFLATQPLIVVSS
jgi:broad specificity phosphatase PhoE